MKNQAPLEWMVEYKIGNLFVAPSYYDTKKEAKKAVFVWGHGQPARLTNTKTGKVVYLKGTP